jgi:hypothetical protein
MRITVAIAVAAVSWRSAKETRKTRAAATARARDIAFMRLTEGARLPRLASAAGTALSWAGWASAGWRAAHWLAGLVRSLAGWVNGCQRAAGQPSPGDATPDSSAGTRWRGICHCAG